jgi:hypothetical protein
MVLYIDRTSSSQLHDISVQKYDVQACLRVLHNIRYNIPTYSSMRITALNVGLDHNIRLFCAQLAEDNMNDVVSLITYIQINCYVYIYAWFL